MHASKLTKPTFIQRRDRETQSKMQHSEECIDKVKSAKYEISRVNVKWQNMLSLECLCDYNHLVQEVW